MELRDLIKLYQRFDPETGTFTARRSLRQYAALLGISPMVLSRVYNGVTDHSPTALAAFVRAFPVAREAAVEALAVKRPERTSDEKEEYVFPDIPYLMGA